MMGGLARENYGTMRNVQINVIESIENPNYAIFLMFYSNFGTVENFIVNLEEPIYAKLPTCVYENYGTMKNGYMYGENIKLINKTMGIGACIDTNRDNGILENVYTLISVDNLYSSNVANLVRANRENATVQNVYSVKIGENVTDLSSGPNVGSKSSKKVFNNYYFADEIFTSELETKGNKLSLWDAEFQNQIINSDGAFIVDELVNEGYYPHLNMPDCMPLQEYIELPEVEDADLPDILSTKILEQGTDTVKVEFSVNNPSAETISAIQIENIDVEIISQEYKDRKSTVIAELKNPIICVSSYDLLSISTRGAFNSSYTREYEGGERVINVDLYNEIWSVSDWKNINDSPSENYMLMNDLDFINEGNNIYVSVVRGIIDGGGHSLTNIRLDGDWSLIFSLYGSLENLYISNFTQDYATDGGVIRRVESGAVIDNVHLSNAKITKKGSVNVGGIAWYSIGSSIRNSSINNIEIIAQENLSELNIGGLVGNIENTIIENCYVANLKIKDSKAVNSAIGGLVGIVGSSSRIANSYTEGSISSDNSNVGGIVGTLITGKLENCYSKVNISTTNNNVGGIIGVFSDSETESIVNNLSIGNIYTTSGTNNLNRIIGNKTDTAINNYSYEKQLLNGYVSIEEKGATLLSKGETLNLDLGDSYKYDENQSGILPKLYNSKGTELLPSQKDIYIDNNSEDVDIQIENIEATKPNTTEAEIEIRINNPEEIEIIGITIEDMASTITRSVTKNGITNITVRSIPERYYDSYKLTEIKYKTSDDKEEQVKEVETEIKVQFYKELYTYEDWQAIELGTYQNYRLMADIDFSGRDNIKSNITVNRLEAENNVYTLKNIELEFNEENTGLINNIKTSMKNIKFENITLSNTINSGKYFGLIATNNGNLENVSFENIIINSDNMDNVGVIGGIISGNVGNVDLNDISIKGHSSVGGLIGHADLSIDIGINNITGNNITIEASADYVGGIWGYNEISSTIEVNNIKIENSNITGRSYVGGIFGYLSYSGNIENLKTNNLEIYGNSYVGGVVGRVYASSVNAIFCNIQTISTTMNCTGSYIGGVAGNTVNIYIRYVEVSNTIINAPNMDTQYVGGISGASNTIDLRYFQIDNIEIHTNGTDISGVLNNGGGFASTYFGYIINSTIQGNNNVGGVIGSSSYSSIGDVYVNANIKANTNTAGGVIGYLDNTNMSASSNVVTIYRTMVMDTSIEAPTKSGGFIGDIAKEIYRNGTFYYNNYIDADVIVENESTGSLIIGGRPVENPYIENTYVYKYSKLNGDYVYTTNDNIDDEQYLIRTDLENQSTYTNKIKLGTTYFDYASLQESKYPTIKDTYLYKPELQEGVNLPTDPEIVDLNSLGTEDENDATTTEQNSNNILAQSMESLPEVTIYPISVNEINIDFSSIPENTSFAYYINGAEIETINLTEKTYTFEYNFVDAIEIVVSNGVDEESITINPGEVRSEISLLGDNHAYLIENNLYINGELQSGEYVNVYEGYALSSSGHVLNISSKEVLNSITEENSNILSEQTIETSNTENIEKGLIETILEKSAKPLHTYEY